jgi:hypothetical protein
VLLGQGCQKEVGVVQGVVVVLVVEVTTTTEEGSTRKEGSDSWLEENYSGQHQYQMEQTTMTTMTDHSQHHDGQPPLLHGLPPPSLHHKLGPLPPLHRHLPTQ